MDVQGRFFSLRQPEAPCNWTTWYHAQYPAASLDDVVATFQGSSLNETCLCLPQYRYVIHLFKKIHLHEVCGLYDPNGKFHALQPPCFRTFWEDWVCRILGEAVFHLTATVDGKPIPTCNVLLPGRSYLIRLHAGLKGGGKDATGRLGQLLSLKGVPSEAVDERVKEDISEEQVHQALQSLDLRESIKGLAGQKVRLILPQNLKPRTPWLGKA